MTRFKQMYLTSQVRRGIHDSRQLATALQWLQEIQPDPTLLTWAEEVCNYICGLITSKEWAKPLAAFAAGLLDPWFELRFQRGEP